MISRSMPCFLKIPAFSPRYEIDVSQLPRWPTVSLRRSAVSAGAVAVIAAAVAITSVRVRACVIVLSVFFRPASDCLFLALLFGPAQHRGCGDRRIAGFDPYIDNGHLTVLDRRDRLLECRHQIARVNDGVEPDGALRFPQRRAIDVRIRDALADPTVLDRAVADAGDALLVQFVVEERAVVADDDEQRNAVMHRGPDRGCTHEEVAVSADGDRQASRAFERERRAYRHAGPAADAAATLGADVIERMMERPDRTVPGERQVGERHVTVPDRGLERLRQVIHPQRTAGGFVGFRFGLHRRRL